MQAKIRRICVWFGRYVRSFYGRDRYTDVNLRCKHQHSHHVAVLAARLALRLGLDGDLAALAQAAGLLHDVGRFEQFAAHRTFMDASSIDHGAHGLQVLRRYQVLEELDPAGRSVIEAAVSHHNKTTLPGSLSGRGLLVTRIIRDCDKLDIYRIVLGLYTGRLGGDGQLDLVDWLPDRPECSPAILAALSSGRPVDASCISTLNDLKLMQLGWVYDINFTETLESLARARYVQSLADTIPQLEGVQEAKAAVMRYLADRLAGRASRTA